MHSGLLCCLLAATVISIVTTTTDAAAQQQSCGGQGQRCCLACGSDVAPADCDQWECTGNHICHTFGIRTRRRTEPRPDGSSSSPEMNICMQNPADCGKPGQPCCYSGDPTVEAERCGAGLACISQRLGYGDRAMYHKLLADPAGLKSKELMGVCRNMTQADCGKRFFPCGAAARRMGCPENKLLCSSSEDFCASPADTMLGAARCLPLPPRCGQRNNPCCPANKGGTMRELWINDNQSAVPYCTDGTSMCVWQHRDFGSYGLRAFLEAGGSRTLLWDGYFARGYGQSRCLPLPAATCGNPGALCCPSMIDQRLSGMVHNSRFKHQPCNYQAAGKHGIFCKGAWQGELLNATNRLGTCTQNSADCGRLGKQCCREDIAESGPVAICETSSAPGTHYCTEDNVCTKCPNLPTTKLQKENCRGPNGQIEAAPVRGGRGFGGPRG